MEEYLRVLDAAVQGASKSADEVDAWSAKFLDIEKRQCSQERMIGTIANDLHQLTAFCTKLGEFDQGQKMDGMQLAFDGIKVPLVHEKISASPMPVVVMAPEIAVEKSYSNSKNNGKQRKSKSHQVVPETVVESNPSSSDNENNDHMSGRDSQSNQRRKDPRQMVPETVVESKHRVSDSEGSHHGSSQQQVSETVPECSQRRGEQHRKAGDPKLQPQLTALAKSCSLAAAAARLLVSQSPAPRWPSAAPGQRTRASSHSPARRQRSPSYRSDELSGASTAPKSRPPVPSRSVSPLRNDVEIFSHPRISANIRGAAAQLFQSSHRVGRRPSSQGGQ